MSMETTFKFDVEQAVADIMAYAIHTTEKNLSPAGKLHRSLNIDFTGGLIIGQLFAIKTLLIDVKDELPKSKFEELIATIENAIGEINSWGHLARSAQAGRARK